MEKKELVLKVMEALQEEVYKGIVRIDSETMHLIDVRPGDIVEIEGNRVTVGIVDRAYPTDIGQAVIRMDGILRRNARTGIGESVKVRKAEVKEAKSITLAPAQEGIMIQANNPELLKRSLLGRAVIKGDIIALGGTRRRRRSSTDPSFDEIINAFEETFGNFSLSNIKFIVADATPKQSVIISENTQVNINPKAVEVKEEKIPEVSYEDLGGLEEEIKKIREMVELPLKHPEIFTRLGIDPPSGVLLHGPPGSGKTLLAKAVANESQANFILINGPEIMNKFYGESEKKIREIFDDAEQKAPSIIFIDEIDAIASKREDTHGEVERRVVAQLLTMMDGLKTRKHVVVIGATNRPNSLDPALRRPGRFDREITIGVPNMKGRLEILKIHSRNMPLSEDVNIEKLAEITHGFVGADISALTKEAAMNVLRRILPDINLREAQPIPNEMLEKLKVAEQDFKESLKIVRPSALREVLIENPNVHWNDVGGLDSLKTSLKETIEWPIKYKEEFSKLGIKSSKGILLYGPPGTGKTLLAKAIATESQANFISVKGSSLFNMWVGESEKGLRKIFEKARQAAPTVIFFDEIDSMAPKRAVGSGVTKRMVNTLLSEMDGLEQLNDIIVIAATNRPDILDPALLRPGRFDRIISVPIPEKKSRLEIIKVHTSKMSISKDVNIEMLSEKTENFSGADIESLCKEAGLAALRRYITEKDVPEISEKSDTKTKKSHSKKTKYENRLEILHSDFEASLKKIKPSISPEELKKYQEVEEEYIRMAKNANIKQSPQSYFG